MDGKYKLSDVYKDFFETPLVEIEEDNKEVEKVPFEMDTIDTLLLEEESKDLLKKVVEYMRKVMEEKTLPYLDFHLILESDNKETITKFEEIIEHANQFYHYVAIKKRECSFYEVDTIDKVKEVFQNDIIIIKDIKGINLRDEEYKRVFFHVLEENLEKKIIIVEGVKEDIDYFFQLDNTLRERAFPFTFVGRNPDVQDVYEEVLELTHHTREEEFSIKILDYISETYPKTEYDYPTYRDGLVREVLFHGDVPKLESEKTMDEIFEKLNELVGLEKVKKSLHELVDYMSLKDKATDLKLNNINLHMVFLGNPGTGKTTVARIIVDILYHLKYIKQNKLIEVSSKDLVAEYVGQTAPKTMAVIERARGGVLFIDEAYALASKDNQNSYNAEAIATLIKAMEDYRDELVVIFAGYTKEMQDFLDSNSGIVSRVGYTMEFDDYTEDELVEIFKGMVKKAGFSIEEDAILRLREIIKENIGTKNFGNARFVRNVYEKSIIKHAANTKDKKRKKILTTITKEDISDENLKSYL